ncbi:MAG: hypothetical protein HY287_07565 [Planctomycetes bacterium]|nr:hypothetical protein [Planctomycetota bacterium]
MPVIRAFWVLGVAPLVFLPDVPAVRAQGPPATVANMLASSPSGSSTNFHLVYDNSLGAIPLNFPARWTVADDIHTTAYPGCALDRYEVQVHGEAPFGIDLALYDGCPGQGGQPIVGTQAHRDVGAGDPVWLSVDIPLDTTVPLPTSLWVQVTFDDAGSWIHGAPALVGFSDDLYDDPVFGCGAFLGRFPQSPHSSFNARIYVRDPCPSMFFGYRSSGPAFSSFNPGAGVRMAEELHLGVPSCNLVGFEVLFRGGSQFDVDIRLPNANAAGLPGSIIDGTHAVFATATNAVSIKQRVFDEPVTIPDDVWFSVSSSSPGGRTVFVQRPPRMGAVDGSYAVLQADGTWQSRQLDADRAFAAFAVSLWCEGDAPKGACCDMYLTDAQGDAVCRDVPFINCAYPGPDSPLRPAWKPSQICGPNTFNPPCGAAACCRADGTCENRSASQCVSASISWTLGTYCDAQTQCEYYCSVNDALCTDVHPSVGCADARCCRDICESGEVGAFCCVTEWDDTCVQLAAELCSLPPANDECAAIARTAILGAKLIDVPGSELSDGAHATNNSSDPGFCCRSDAPGTGALGTVWYKFIAPTSHVELSTCASSAPADDSLLQVFVPGDASADAAACASLRPIACSDDAVHCSDTQKNSRVCLADLTPGEVYYVMIGAKTQASVGAYRLDATPYCTIPVDAGCSCPVGEITWIDPANGVLDPRRPFDPQVPGVSLEARQIRVIAPPGAERRDCWSICGLGATGESLDIVAFRPLADGSALLLLNDAILPGSEADLIYTDGVGIVSKGQFVVQPGNVNGDGAASPADVLALQAALQADSAGVQPSVLFDIDRSGFVTPLDILDLVDLLQGGGAYSPWNGTVRPASPTCP